MLSAWLRRLRPRARSIESPGDGPRQDVPRPLCRSAARSGGSHDLGATVSTRRRNRDLQWRRKLRVRPGDEHTGPQRHHAVDLDFDNDGSVEVSGGRFVADLTQYAFQTTGVHQVRLLAGSTLLDTDVQLVTSNRQQHPCSR